MYLDPGFGSMIVQIIVALIAGAGAILLMAKNKVKSLFHKKNKKESASENENNAEEKSAEYTVEE